MPHTDIKPHYVVDLSHDEFRLITMALGGMVKDPQDVEACRLLNVHLCHQRRNMLESTIAAAQKALEGANKLVEEHIKSK